MITSDVGRFEKLAGQALGLYEGMSILSKKSPNDAVSIFELKFINRQMRESSILLGDRCRPFDEFEEFNEDDIPQNSDVVFIVSQYLQCMDKLRGDPLVFRNDAWYWKVEGEDGDLLDERGYTFIRSV